MREEHTGQERFSKSPFICDCHVLGLQVFLSCLFLDYFHVGRGFCPFSVLYVAQQERRCPALCFPVCFNKAFVHKPWLPVCPSLSPRPGPPGRGAALALWGPGWAGPGRAMRAGAGAAAAAAGGLGAVAAALAKLALVPVGEVAGGPVRKGAGGAGRPEFPCGRPAGGTRRQGLRCSSRRWRGKSALVFLRRSHRLPRICRGRGAVSGSGAVTHPGGAQAGGAD